MDIELRQRLQNMLPDEAGIDVGLLDEAVTQKSQSTINQLMKAPNMIDEQIRQLLTKKPQIIPQQQMDTDMLPAPMPEMGRLSDMERQEMLQQMQDMQGSLVDRPYTQEEDMAMLRSVLLDPATTAAQRNEVLDQYISIYGVPQMQEGGDPMMEMMGDVELDAEEQQTLQNIIQTGEQKQQAPLFEQAQMLAAEGTGEDTILAHLRPGEVVLPPEFMQDAEFEKQVENKFNEFNLDPAAALVGGGIASLNPMTGLEEFGVFKKIGKAFKKVVKKVAPVAGPLANFIPGVGPVLAGAIGAATNLAAGKGLKGAIAGGLGGYGTGKLLGGIGSLGGGAGATQTGGGGISSLFGRAKEFILPGQDGVGLFGNVGKMFTGQQPTVQDIYAQADPTTQVRIERLLSEGASESQILQNLSQSGLMPTTQGGGIGGLFGGTKGQSRLGLIEDLLKGRPSDPVRGGGLFGGTAGQSQIGLVEDFLKGQPSDPARQSQLGQLLGGAGGAGGGFGLGDVGAFGLAGLLGKMAYEEAKKAKGVPLTPLVTMGPTGRYNIEAEIARRTGQAAPNPVEFGLLPSGTIPELTGGKAMGGAVQGFFQGGSVAKMNEGGGLEIELDMSDFERMNGGINGEGTETSDDIPAMLSDGEFVMTGRAVRGAGSYELQQGENGIISLIPSFEEDRERGTQLMYQIMDMFAESARAS